MENFRGKDEYSYKYNGELMIERVHDLEGQITKDVYNYDSEGKNISHQVYMGGELYKKPYFHILQM